MLTADASFDGAVDNVSVREVLLSDLFDGGGSVSVWGEALSDGEGNGGRLLDKTGSGTSQGFAVYVGDESGGNCDLVFHHGRGTTEGVWTTTSRELVIGAPFFCLVTYDSAAVGNNPTMYIGDASGLETHTVGAGLTESSAPVGTQDSDVTQVLYAGNRSDLTRGHDGMVGRCAFFDAELTAAEALRLFQAWRHIYGV